MKRKFVVFVGGVAIVAAAAVNLSISSNNGTLSDLALANIEALAKSEGDGDKGTLYDILNKAGEQIGNCCCPGTDTCGSSGCPSSACS